MKNNIDNIIMHPAVSRAVTNPSERTPALADLVAARFFARAAKREAANRLADGLRPRPGTTESAARCVARAARRALAIGGLPADLADLCLAVSA